MKSVVSRVLQYLRFIMVDFERLKILHDYRTASTLRSFAFFFVSTYPIIFAPYFALLGFMYGIGALIYVCIHPNTKPTHLQLSIFISIVLCSLLQIQNQLEEPFSTPLKVGEDDINLDVLYDVTHRCTL